MPETASPARRSDIFCFDALAGTAPAARTTAKFSTCLGHIICISNLAHYPMPDIISLTTKLSLVPQTYSDPQ